MQAPGFALAVGSSCRLGLPNFAVPLFPVRAVLNAASSAICHGRPAAFRAAVAPAAPGAVFAWDFGDPAAGAANAAAGLSARPQYATAGIWSRYRGAPSRPANCW